MAAEKNITGTYRPPGGSGTTFIDLGADTINILKSLYFSNPSSSGAEINFLQINLSSDGVTIEDTIYSSPAVIPVGTGLDIIPVLSSLIIKPPKRYLAVEVDIDLITEDDHLSWSMSYLTFPATKPPLLDKFNYTYSTFTNSGGTNLLTAPNDVSTIIQSVRVTRIQGSGQPATAVRLALNGNYLSDSVTNTTGSTIVFSSPLYLNPTDVLSVIQAPDVTDTTFIATSYITNT